MNENLNDMLLANKDKKIPKGYSRAIFFARQEEIENALASGWSAKFIWGTLHAQGLFPAKYDCFVKYIQRYIKSKNVKNSSAKAEQVLRTTKPKQHDAKQYNGFVFSPTASSLDDL